MTVFRLPIALLDLVARELGVDPERTSFKPLPTGSRAAALERGEVNLVAGGYEITDQRRSRPPSPGHSRGGSPAHGWSLAGHYGGRYEVGPVAKNMGGNLTGGRPGFRCW